MVCTVDITAPRLFAWLREPRQIVDAYGRTKGEIETSVSVFASSLRGSKRSARKPLWVKTGSALAAVALFGAPFVALGTDNRDLAFVVAALAVLSVFLLPPSLPNGLASARAPLKGQLTYYCGGGLAGLGLILVFAIGLVGYGDLSGRAWFMAVGAAIVTLVAGGMIQKHGRRLLQPTASELQTRDPRRPVVLLRSFGDDNLSIVTGRDQEGGVNTSDFEESIEDQFAPFGPFVAIGKPGERLPTLGAARNYYGDAEWKDAVAKWMDEALALIVIAGLTDGLGWELECIRERGYLGKLIVLMPPRVTKERRGSRAQVRLKRWDTLRAAFADIQAFRDLPEDEPAGLLALHFNADGGLVLLTGPKVAWKQDYERAVRFALYGMFCHEKGGSEMTKVLQSASILSAAPDRLA